MTLDEAIKHCEEIAEDQDKLCKRYDDASGYSRSHNESIRTNEAKETEKCSQDFRQLAGWLKELKALKAEKKNRIAEERYEDLVGYFGGDKTILESREEFQKWLGRIRWHVKKCDELAREKEADQCEDAISRNAAVEAILTKLPDFCGGDAGGNLVGRNQAASVIRNLPSVTPKPKVGHWIKEFNDAEGEVRFVCSNCGKHQLFATDYCYHCGSDNRKGQK